MVTPQVIGALANANDDPYKPKMECPTCGLVSDYGFSPKVTEQRRFWWLQYEKNEGFSGSRGIRSKRGKGGIGLRKEW